MDKKQLINNLRELAVVLKPFIHEPHSSSRVWNGTAYVAAEPKNMDPYALMWWSTLCTTADLLEASESDLTESQIELLRRQLCGGMGSLNDFQINVSSLGDAARTANQLLSQKLETLYLLFEAK